MRLRDTDLLTKLRDWISILIGLLKLERCMNRLVDIVLIYQVLKSLESFGENSLNAVSMDILSMDIQLQETITIF
jgi:hypothetical protein